jgi:hypothetical protein
MRLRGAGCFGEVVSQSHQSRDGEKRLLEVIDLDSVVTVALEMVITGWDGHSSPIHGFARSSVGCRPSRSSSDKMHFHHEET